MIRDFQISDTQQLLDIYNYYVLNTVITFDDVELSLETFTEKVNAINSEYPFIVFEENNELLGYAYGSQFRSKPAYKYSVEVTIYVKNKAQGKQIGTRLYVKLLTELKNLGYHVALGGITLPNEASVSLHEKFGFSKVAHFKHVGKKFGTWLDVGFWQLILD
ncbi:GNAT family N-acetyltransferase [Seonamhaeicola aphaedonensis]|uniref:Phosphinothricin acetyltransferase n=1 Tax=Seonamhaeicola aphaedonensis TaxID=1461338 RepID=A0A3D9HFU1_9FLAO|nr:GNAT family N-acetyltransferase [Seonamhaeicola aphaedonensis]RED48334.1 phosphinothricin acetyltransferase [Seonamhaeicola aphaedonensis]